MDFGDPALLPHENEGPSILAATLTVTLVALMTTAVRLYARIGVIRNVGWDVGMRNLLFQSTSDREIGLCHDSSHAHGMEKCPLPRFQRLTVLSALQANASSYPKSYTAQESTYGTLTKPISSSRISSISLHSRCISLLYVQLRCLLDFFSSAWP